MSVALYVSEDLKPLNVSKHDRQTILRNFSESLSDYFPSKDFAIYDLGGTRQNLDASHRRRGSDRVILLNATASHEEVVSTEGQTIGGVPFKCSTVLPHLAYTSSDLQIVTDQGLPIAYYSESAKKLEIHFDLLNEEELFRSFFTRVKETFGKILMVNSWYFGDKEVINKALDRAFSRNQEALIRRTQEELESVVSNVDYNMKQISMNIRKRDDLMRKLEQMKSGKDAPAQHISNQLEMLKTVDKVEDVRFENGKFKVFTKEIYIQHDRKEAIYYAGKYRIEIDLLNTDVRYFNLTENRRSHWGKKCPHPHVSEQGRPCLGNIATTIAELCATNDMYALTIVLISFLESVNTSDVAGKFIINWDEVDEDGKLVKKGLMDKHPDDYEEEEEHLFYCEACEETVEEDNTYHVYYGINGRGQLNNEANICPDCANRLDVYYSNHYDAYLIGELAEHENNEEDEADRENI